MELSLSKATKILLKAKEQQDGVAMKDSSKKGITLGVRAILRLRSSLWLCPLPPHSETCVDPGGLQLTVLDSGL